MAKKKAATKRRSTKKKTAKKSVNKSQAIRDYAKSNPSHGPTAVSKALAAKGIQVTAAQVSTTLSNAKRNGKNNSAKKKSRSKQAKKASDSVSITKLLATQKFLNEVGDVETARQLLDVVSKLNRA